MTFNDFLKTHKVNGYALCDVNSVHHLSDQEIQLLEETWNAAIMEALRQVSLPCRSGDAGRDRLQDDLAKLLTA